MREKNAVSKDYFRSRERFADLINGYCCHGRQVFRPEDVEERGGSELRIQRTDGGVKARESERDGGRRLLANGISVAVAMLENQDRIHYAMPVRVMNGDSMNYDARLKDIQKAHRAKKDLKGGDEFLSGFSKEDCLLPVFTLVLYYGREKWSGPKRLKGMLDLSGIPAEMRGMIADYPINVMDVRRFRHLEYFQTDIRYVFGFIKKEKSKSALRKFIKENEEAFSAMAEDAYDMICVMTGSTELDKVKNKYQNQEKGDGYNLCQAIRDMVESGKKEGRKEGRSEGICALVETLCELGASVEVCRGKVMEKFQLPEKEAMRYVRKYWKPGLAAK